MNLAFVPRKFVSAYRLRGFEPVEGYDAPAGWAVLMQETGVVSVIAEPDAQSYQTYRSNKSRGASVANYRRYKAIADALWAKREAV